LADETWTFRKKLHIPGIHPEKSSLASNHPVLSDIYSNIDQHEPDTTWEYLGIPSQQQHRTAAANIPKDAQLNRWIPLGCLAIRLALATARAAGDMAVPALAEWEKPLKIDGVWIKTDKTWVDEG